MKEEGESAMGEGELAMEEGEVRKVRKGSAHVQVGTDRLDLWRPVHAAIWVRVVQAYVVDVHAHFLTMNPAKKLDQRLFYEVRQGRKGALARNWYALLSPNLSNLRQHSLASANACRLAGIVLAVVVLI